jgi:hypothetical protein
MDRDLGVHRRRGRNLSDAPLLGSPSVSNFSRTETNTSSSTEKGRVVKPSKEDLFCGVFRGKKSNQTDRFQKCRDSIHLIPRHLRRIEEGSEECMDVQQFLKGEIRIETRQLERRKRGTWRRLLVLLKRLTGKDVDYDHLELGWPQNRRIRQRPRRLRKRSLVKCSHSRNIFRQKFKKDSSQTHPRERAETLMPNLIRKPGSNKTPERYVPEVSTVINATARGHDEKIREAGAKALTINRAWRAESDGYLAARGRYHVNNPLIGKAPPISRRILEEDRLYIPLVTGNQLSILRKNKIHAQQFPLAVKISPPTMKGAKFCDSSCALPKQDRILTAETNHIVSTDTTLLKPNTFAPSSRPSSTPEARSFLRAEGIVVPSIHGLSLSLPRDFKPTNDEGISLNNETAELNNKLSLKKAKGEEETPGGNGAIQVGNGMIKDVILGLDLDANAKPKFERPSHIAANSNATESLILFSDVRTLDQHICKDESMDKVNCELNTKLRKLSLPTPSQPDSSHGVSNPTESPTNKPRHGQSNSKSSRGRFPVAPSPTMFCNSKMSGFSATSGFSPETEISKSNEFYRTSSSRTSNATTPISPQFSTGAFSFDDAIYSVSRRPSVYDVKLQNTNNTSNWLHSNMDGEWQNEIPRSPVLSESPSQVAMDRRQDKKALVLDTVSKKLHRVDYQDIEETQWEAKNRDSTKQPEIPRIEPLGRARAKIIRRPWSTRRKTGRSAKESTDSSGHFAIGEELSNWSTDSNGEVSDELRSNNIDLSDFQVSAYKIMGVLIIH